MFIVLPIGLVFFGVAKESFFSSNPSAKKKFESAKKSFDFAGNIIAWLAFWPLMIAFLGLIIFKDASIGWGLFLVYLAFLWFGLAVYLIPTYVCILRKVEQKAGIILLNVFLGWSILGWVGALIWASIAPTLGKTKT